MWRASSGVFPSSGDATVLWKQGDRVISAGPVQVRKDARITLVEAQNLRISGIDVADTGQTNLDVLLSTSTRKKRNILLNVYLELTSDSDY
jgi:hypothetical protein